MFPPLLDGLDLPSDDRTHHHNAFFPPEVSGSPGLLPSGYTTAPISRAMSLVSHARAPQRVRAVVDGPLMLWRMVHPVQHTYRARLLGGPVLPPETTAIEEGRAFWKHAAVSLRLPTTEAEVTLTLTERRLSIEVTSVPRKTTGTVGYLAIGIADVHLDRLQEVVVTADGARVPATLWLARRESGESALRLVTNHAWHIDPAVTSGRFLPGAEAGRRCRRMEGYDGPVLVYGAGAPGDPPPRGCASP